MASYSQGGGQKWSSGPLTVAENRSVGVRNLPIVRESVAVAEEMRWTLRESSGVGVASVGSDRLVKGVPVVGIIDCRDVRGDCEVPLWVPRRGRDMRVGKGELWVPRVMWDMRVVCEDVLWAPLVGWSSHDRP